MPKDTVPMKQTPGKNCTHAAFAVLARRDHSRAELTKKLQKRGYSESEVQTAIDECVRLDYIDDRKFAVVYSRQLQRKGYGRRHIRHVLQSKGVVDRIVTDVIERICQNAAEEYQCHRMLKKKLRTMKPGGTPSEITSKVHRYLLGRGFEPAIVQRIIGRAPNSNPSTQARPD
jgi:regulatory protein